MHRACPTSCVTVRPPQTGVGSSLLMCSMHQSLASALDLLAVAAGRVERLVCVDEGRRVTGIVALSDIFAFFSAQDPTALPPLPAPGAIAATAAAAGSAAPPSPSSSGFSEESSLSGGGGYVAGVGMGLGHASGLLGGPR